MPKQSRWGKRVSQGLVAGALFGLGSLWGNGTICLLPVVRADVTEGETPQAFLAGGERAELVLRDIAQILRDDIVGPLKQIDARLARIEAIAEGGEREAPPPRRRGGNGGTR
ncbi:MAG TPA: hypothetical protein VGX78_01835 [Pirellulales bacterium]|jgi:hypothetical protein|nr:hypothetical protein [Pirellulales bacterium]